MIKINVLSANLTNEKYSYLKGALEFLEDSSDTADVKYFNWLANPHKSVDELIAKEGLGDCDFIIYVEVEPIEKIDKRYMLIYHDDTPETIEAQVDMGMNYLGYDLDGYKGGVVEEAYVQRPRRQKLTEIEFNGNIFETVFESAEQCAVEEKSISGFVVLIDGNQVRLSREEVEYLFKVREMIDVFGYKIESVLV